ncbi:aldolase [Candidatus Methylacidiphilum infernorum]|uniref:fructose-bisphosphate aldolase n=1 Tax=Candidatus Methylacidiphilum infernorum TaxID=511746 RepID=A0ABX7PX21_9BACT|nr:aldolase [Candidatus Methylacidiphilum infernorum]QSR87532.1 aldolase [Candidatus Methylacidiphilum infernorum]
MIRLEEIKVPLDVPESKKDDYRRIFFEVTQGSGRLMLMAGDQKVEHLNDDFFGEGIAPDDANPEHLFRIASRARIGAFATQLGLIARYAMDYSNIRYIVKLNSKTHLVKTAQRDPLSLLWLDFEQLDYFIQTKSIPIVGIGYTVYPGSEYEPQMLREAARLVFEAHQRGLIAIIWSYPRGRAVSNETDPHLIAGAAGLAACLGADFVKVNPPKVKEGDPHVALREAVAAAGRTRLICAGGKEIGVKDFLTQLYGQIHIGGAFGNATGRNIHQKPLNEAIAFCNAISAITFDGVSVEEAFAIYKES